MTRIQAMARDLRRARIGWSCLTAALYCAVGDDAHMGEALHAVEIYLKPNEWWPGGAGRGAES